MRPHLGGGARTAARRPRRWLVVGGSPGGSDGGFVVVGRAGTGQRRVRPRRLRPPRPPRGRGGIRVRRGVGTGAESARRGRCPRGGGRAAWAGRTTAGLAGAAVSPAAASGPPARARDWHPPLVGAEVRGRGRTEPDGRRRSVRDPARDGQRAVGTARRSRSSATWRRRGDRRVDRRPRGGSCARADRAHGPSARRARRVGARLAGPGGLVWSLETGAPRAGSPGAVALGVHVGTPRGLRGHRLADQRPRVAASSTRRAGQDRPGCPLDPDDTRRSLARGTTARCTCAPRGRGARDPRRGRSAGPAAGRSAIGRSPTRGRHGPVGPWRWPGNRVVGATQVRVDRRRLACTRWPTEGEAP